MFKKEFIKYIASFKKEPGRYTKDEIFAIGYAHRQLPRHEKNWNTLAEILGVHGDGEYLRKNILSKVIREQKRNKNNKSKYGSHESVNLAPIPVVKENKKTESESEAEIQRLIKERQKYRDERSAYMRTLREQSRIESLKELINSAVHELKDLPDFNNIDYLDKVDTDTEAVLLLSDLHIGAYVDSFYNKYNLEIAQARVKQVVEETIQYCKTHHVAKLNILNLGDNIQGIIHVTGRIEQATDVISQIMFAGEVVSQAVCELQKAAPEVTYRSCTDNHARVIADIKQSIEKENLGRLIDWFVKERLRDTSIRFEDDNLDDDIGLFSLKNRKNVLFVHGHLDKDFENLILGIQSKTKKTVDYVCLGHYHSSKAWFIQNTRVFINSSVMGADTYAGSRRLYGPASQTLLIFSNDNEIVINIGLNEISK